MFNVEVEALLDSLRKTLFGGRSIASCVASLPERERAAFLETIPKEHFELLQHYWPFHARQSQLAPKGQWSLWLYMAGRGAGKTRSGAEWIHDRVQQRLSRRIALVAPTAADVRDTMIEGPSGLLNVGHPSERPVYEPSKRKLTWPNGAIGLCFSAEEPDRLRGPQFDTGWADELAIIGEETWDMLMFGMRLGNDPRVIATTTPRPTPFIKQLMKDENTVVTRGSTYDNQENLAEVFLKKIIQKYEGTRLGRQEIYAEVLTDVPGALWSISVLDELRVKHRPEEMKKISIGVDPATTGGEDADECGIVVAGLASKTLANGEVEDEGFVLGDRSMQGSPEQWAQAVINAYDEFSANEIVVEANNGGELLKSVFKSVAPKREFPIKLVWAKKSKYVRAEPISALYEKKRVHHVGTFAKLEDQMSTYVPGETESPDRMDALVYALMAIFGEAVMGAIDLDSGSKEDKLKKLFNVTAVHDKGVREEEWNL